MELEHSMPISQMGMLRPDEAPSKAGVGPGLEPGALGCSSLALAQALNLNLNLTLTLTLALAQA